MIKCSNKMELNTKKITVNFRLKLNSNKNLSQCHNIINIENVCLTRKVIGVCKNFLDIYLVRR